MCFLIRSDLLLISYSHYKTLIILNLFHINLTYSPWEDSSEDSKYRSVASYRYNGQSDYKNILEYKGIKSTNSLPKYQTTFLLTKNSSLLNFI